VKEHPSLVWHLRNTPLFNDLSPEDVEQIAKITPYRQFAAGDVIYRMEDPADALYFIRDGQVKISKFFPSGKEMILAILGQYDIFGELLLGQEQRRPNQAQAIAPTTLIALPDKEFRRLLELRPDIAMKFIKVISGRLWEAQSQVAETATFDAAGRLAMLLYKLAVEFGHEDGDSIRIDLNLTQEDLAKMIGATRETVSHSLAKFHKEGLITRRGMPLAVDVERLRLVLEEA
jgi:CRP/FNR family transcriptional regulator